jgi:hypothetical protein
MSAYLSNIQAEARSDDLREQARRPRPAGAGSAPPRRLRVTVARTLMGLAIRLEHGLRTTPTH